MPSARPQLQSKNVDDQTWLLSFVLHTHRRSKDLLLPTWATSSFTTVAGQGWLVGLAEPALDAGTTLAYRRGRRQGGCLPFAPFAPPACRLCRDLERMICVVLVPNPRAVSLGDLDFFDLPRPGFVP